MNNISDNLNIQDTLSLLKWYVDSGVDETIGDETLNWFTLPQQPVQNTSANTETNPDSKAVASRQVTLVTVEQIAQEAAQLAASCETLSKLYETIKNFTGCSLKKTAANTVFSDGNPDSHIMLIGEVPGVDEDRQGKPFIGESGQLLDRMFKAIDLDRKNDFYLTNLIPWRPPGNRNPTPEEIAICMPFIKRHIELFDPKMIILLGGISATNLLKSKEGINRLRGKWSTYNLKGHNIPVRPLFHPSYLLKQPRSKGDTWLDLLEIKARIKELAL